MWINMWSEGAFHITCTDKQTKCKCEHAQNMHSNTSLAAFHDSTLDYSELRCNAARARSTARQLGSRKQYKIDMHAPLPLWGVRAWMPGGVALLTQASLLHCNTGSLIRNNKWGNEVRQRGEALGRGRADPSFCLSKLRQSSWHQTRIYYACI